MERIEFDRSKLEDTFKMAENSLFSEPNIHWLQYEKPFICQNQVEVFDLIKNVAIVYCIWISDGLHLKPIYIGHSSAILAKQRLTNHFIKKHVRTGAQLERIQEAVLEGKKIGISFLKIEPDYMRKPLEEWLILRNREKLTWNIHGKRL
jgi:hypothetical protein